MSPHQPAGRSVVVTVDQLAGDMLETLALPRLRSFCGCPLRRVARAVGFLHMIGIALLLVIFTTKKIRRGMEKPLDPLYEPDEYKSLFSREEDIMRAIFLLFLTSVVLLYGIRIQEPDWIEPFLVTKASILLTLVLELLVMLTYRLIGHRDIFLYIQLLFIVVYSYYREMKEVPVSVQTDIERVVSATPYSPCSI